MTEKDEAMYEWIVTVEIVKPGGLRSTIKINRSGVLLEVPSRLSHTELRIILELAQKVEHAHNMETVVFTGGEKVRP